IERTVWSRQTTALGVPGTDADGLGGWTLSPHHVFDPQGLGTVSRGDGSVIRGDLSPSTVRSLTCTSGSCSPVITLGQLQVYVSALAYGRNGDLYIADQGILLGNAITVYRVRHDTVTVIAGDGTKGTWGSFTDGPATARALPNAVIGMAVRGDGGIYLACSDKISGHSLLALVTPDGYIHKM